MATVQEIVDSQSGAFKVKDIVKTSLAAEKGVGKVKENMDAHRRRLAYRNRAQVKVKSKECIELRRMEPVPGVHDEIVREQVDLTHWEDTRSPVEKMFEAMDLNRDGRVGFEEVIQWLTSLKMEDRPKGMKHVNVFQKKKVKKSLQKMDTDGSGELSFEEIEVWWNETQRPELDD